MPVDQKFTKPGAPLAELDAAWQAHLADAEALFAAKRYAWAIVSALYALEIRLKVLICKRLDLKELPRAFEIHDLDALLLLAGLSRRIESKRLRKVKRNGDDILSQAEELNEIRYKPEKNWTRAQAARLLQQLKDPSEGVLTWLSKQR
jgi:HEPN domain-containing protein